jgi:hypothetical protein
MRKNCRKALLYSGWIALQKGHYCKIKCCVSLGAEVAVEQNVEAIDKKFTDAGSKNKYSPKPQKFTLLLLLSGLRKEYAINRGLKEWKSKAVN